MTSICIAGSSRPELLLVWNIMRQAGMAAPVRGDGPGTMDMAAWHDQVFQEASGALEQARVVGNPSREQAQQAAQLFGPGVQSRVWGWADARSTWLLNFWQSLEPGLRFLLVAVAPQEVLARAIADARDDVDVDHLMTNWHAHHEQLLRFHHRNPECSLLVDGCECAQFPTVLVERCVSHWRLPLKAASANVGSLAAPDELCAFVADRFCERYPQVVDLQHELVATRIGLGGPASANLRRSQVHGPAPVLAALRQLRQAAASSVVVQGLKSEVDRLGAELELVRNGAVEQARLAALRLQAAGGEGELLLTQLMSLQEDLEDSIAANAEKAAALDTALTNLKQSERDNELLDQQLRQVQDELQRYFRQYQEVQRQWKHAADRWQRMLERTPDYCDYLSLEAVGMGDSPRPSISWRLVNLEAAGRSVPEMRFDTIVDQGTAGIALRRQPGTAAPLLRWPTCLSGNDEALLVPVGQSPAELGFRQQVLSELSTSDWDFLRALAEALARALRISGELPLPDGLDGVAFLAAVNQLQRRLDRLPAVLRYDHVLLKREQVNPDYEHLWLRFTNLSLAGLRWPEFEFRLSCAEVRPDRFGHFPKLEFPQGASELPFESWFVEATDDFGPKLELRFALPDSMDLDVWRRVSERDRGFLSALLERLPAVLTGLQATGVSLQRPWQDWIRMAQDMRDVAAFRTGSGRVGGARVLRTVAGLLHNVVRAATGAGQVAVPAKGQASAPLERR